jgi:predicted nucleic acid-binding protein
MDVQAATLNKKRYLVDTSTMIALSRSEFESLKTKGVLLCASTYSCWELLSHLDERGRFQRQKAQLLKFELIDVLDDPQLFIEDSLSLPRTHPVTDADLIHAALAALQHSDTLDQFYVAYIHDTQGSYREIVNVAERARQYLDTLEKNYAEVTTGLVNHLLSKPDIHDSTTYPGLIISMLHSDLERLQKRDACITIQQVAKYFWVYWGYIFCRCLNCVRTHALIDPNDYEDANICKHFATDSAFVFVTADKPTINALDQLKVITATIDPAVITLSLVVKHADFLKQLANTTSAGT